MRVGVPTRLAARNWRFFCTFFIVRICSYKGKYIYRSKNEIVYEFGLFHVCQVVVLFFITLNTLLYLLACVSRLYLSIYVLHIYVQTNICEHHWRHNFMINKNNLEANFGVFFLNFVFSTSLLCLLFHT